MVALFHDTYTDIYRGERIIKQENLRNYFLRFLR